MNMSGSNELEDRLNSIIGGWLRDKRADSGLSIEEAIERFNTQEPRLVPNMPSSWLKSIEAGHKSISVECLYRLSAIYHIKDSEFSDFLKLLQAVHSKANKNH
jgi:transcriptional regulator with XRE-family HTH domain